MTSRVRRKHASRVTGTSSSVSITDIHWWYGTMGESVFDRYSFVHAFMFVWVAIIMAQFCRNPLELLVVMVLCAAAWETFESVVLTDLAFEPFTGTESVRNRYIGDTISDLAGYVTFLAAIWTVRHGMMRASKGYAVQGRRN